MMEEEKKKDAPVQGVVQELEEMTAPRLFEKEDPHMHLRHGERERVRKR